MTPRVVEPLVGNFFNFAVGIGAALAFGALVWAGVAYMAAAGNPAKQRDAMDRAISALLGLLLLFMAFMILRWLSGPGRPLTDTMLPDLKDKLEVPKAQPPGALVPATRTCQGTECQESPQLTEIVACLRVAGYSLPITTTGGAHNVFSCHFGGRSCTDGGHALDMGINGLRSIGKTLFDAMRSVGLCGAQKKIQTACFCEDASGKRYGDCFDPAVNHVHCNVANAGCGCN